MKEFAKMFAIIAVFSVIAVVICAITIKPEPEKVFVHYEANNCPICEKYKSLLENTREQIKSNDCEDRSYCITAIQCCKEELADHANHGHYVEVEK